jgi:hypothetical protein
LDYRFFYVVFFRLTIEREQGKDAKLLPAGEAQPRHCAKEFVPSGFRIWRNPRK